MSASPFTSIPTSQPSCGSLSLENPFPYCANVTDTDPQACFVQPTGFYCAPVATTRGFIYTLNNGTLSPFLNSTALLNSSTFLPLIPRFSFPAEKDDNSTNSTGIDGQPVRRKGPIRLGQICHKIPSPPMTDPLFTLLIAMANQNLANRVGNPGMSVGVDVLSLRSDCEPGSYCDFLQGADEGQGRCKEQFPLYHACESYLECISLRCDSSPGSTNSKSSVASIDGDFKGSKLTKRISRSICLPPLHQLSGSGTGGQGESNDDSKDSPVIPPWAYALIAVLIVMGVGLVLVLTKRQRRRDKRRKQPLKERRPRQRHENNPQNRAVCREKEHTMNGNKTVSGASGGDKKLSISTFRRWLKDNDNGDKNNSNGNDTIIQLGFEGSPASTNITNNNRRFSTNSNNSNIPRTGSINDSGSVYPATNSVYTTYKPQQDSPKVVKSSYDHANNVRVIDLYHVDLDSHHNNVDSSYQDSTICPSSKCTQSDISATTNITSNKSQTKKMSPSIHSSQQSDDMLPRIITTSFESVDSPPTIATARETSSPLDPSWNITPTTIASSLSSQVSFSDNSSRIMIPTPISLAPASPTDSSKPSPPSLVSHTSSSSLSSPLDSTASIDDQALSLLSSSPSGSKNRQDHCLSVRLVDGQSNHPTHQQQTGRFQEGELFTHTQNQLPPTSYNRRSSNNGRKKHSVTTSLATTSTTGSGSSQSRSTLTPPLPSPISPISPLSPTLPASMINGTVGTSRLSSRW